MAGRPGGPKALTDVAGLGFVAGDVESGRKMTKLLGVQEAGPWAVWRKEMVQRALRATWGKWEPRA